MRDGRFKQLVKRHPNVTVVVVVFLVFVLFSTVQTWTEYTGYAVIGVPPTVTLETPDDEFTLKYEKDLIFTANATDSGQLVNVSFYTNQTGVWTRVWTTTLSGSIARESYKWTDIPDGKYLWGFLFCDNDGNCVNSTRSFTMDYSCETDGLGLICFRTDFNSSISNPVKAVDLHSEDSSNNFDDKGIALMHYKGSQMYLARDAVWNYKAGVGRIYFAPYGSIFRGGMRYPCSETKKWRWQPDKILTECNNINPSRNRIEVETAAISPYAFLTKARIRCTDSDNCDLVDEMPFIYSRPTGTYNVQYVTNINGYSGLRIWIDATDSNANRSLNTVFYMLVSEPPDHYEIDGDEHRLKWRMDYNEEKDIISVLLTENELGNVAAYLSQPDDYFSRATSEVEDYLNQFKYPSAAQNSWEKIRYYYAIYDFWFNTLGPFDGRPSYWGDSEIIKPGANYNGIWIWDSFFGAFAFASSCRDGASDCFDIPREWLDVIIQNKYADNQWPRQVLDSSKNAGWQAPGGWPFAIWELHKRDPDNAYLCSVYPDLKDYHEWVLNYQDGDGDYRFYWTGTDSGWDGSARWEPPSSEEALDLQGWMIVGAESLRNMAQICAPEEVALWNQRITNYNNAAQGMWQNNMFWDLSASTDLPADDGFGPTLSAAIYFMMFANVTTTQQDAYLVAELHNPTSLGPDPTNDIGILPTISRSDHDFDPNADSQTWSGSNWININLVAYLGLIRKGLYSEADYLKQYTLSQLAEGQIGYEAYNSVTGGKVTGGFGGWPYIWSDSAYIAMMNDWNPWNTTAVGAMLGDPVIILPSNGANITNTTTVLLEYIATNANSYEVYGDTDPDPSNLLYTGTDTSYEWSGLINDNTYYWKVSASNSTHTKTSDTNFFFLDKSISQSYESAIEITLDYPSDGRLEVDGAVIFGFTLNTTLADTCILYTDKTGSMQPTATLEDSTDVYNAIESDFDDGIYDWNIWCNNTAGNGYFAVDDRTFTVSNEPFITANYDNSRSMINQYNSSFTFYLGNDYNGISVNSMQNTIDTVKPFQTLAHGWSMWNDDTESCLVTYYGGNWLDNKLQNDFYPFWDQMYNDSNYKPYIRGIVLDDEAPAKWDVSFDAVDDYNSQFYQIYGYNMDIGDMDQISVKHDTYEFYSEGCRKGYSEMYKRVKTRYPDWDFFYAPEIDYMYGNWWYDRFRSIEYENMMMDGILVEGTYIYQAGEEHYAKMYYFTKYVKNLYPKRTVYNLIQNFKDATESAITNASAESIKYQVAHSYLAGADGVIYWSREYTDGSNAVYESSDPDAPQRWSATISISNYLKDKDVVIRNPKVLAVYPWYSMAADQDVDGRAIYYRELYALNKLTESGIEYDVLSSKWIISNPSVLDNYDIIFALQNEYEPEQLMTLLINSGKKIVFDTNSFMRNEYNQIPSVQFFQQIMGKTDDRIINSNIDRVEYPNGTVQFLSGTYDMAITYDNELGALHQYYLEFDSGNNEIALLRYQDNFFIGIDSWRAHDTTGEFNDAFDYALEMIFQYYGFEASQYNMEGNPQFISYLNHTYSTGEPVALLAWPDTHLSIDISTHSNRELQVSYNENGCSNISSVNRDGIIHLEGTICDSVFLEFTGITVDGAPKLNLNSPASGQILTSNTVTFNCTATDDNQVVSLALWTDVNSWQQETSVAGNNINHQMLIPDGTYTWNCHAVDNASQSGWGSNRTFTVDTAPPAIYNLYAANITNDSAKVYWNTDKPADATVHYGATLPLIDSVTVVESTSTHSVYFSELDNLTRYYYIAQSCNVNGCVNTTIENFTTLKTYVDYLPPVVSFDTPTPLNGSSLSYNDIVINVTCEDDNPDYATLNWNGNNENIIFKDGTQFWQFKNDQSNAAFTISVTCYDSWGNSAISEERTFTIDVDAPLFCGDEICNNGETCSSCEGDCGACPVEEQPSGGGGGGSYPSFPVVEEVPEDSGASDEETVPEIEEPSETSGTEETKVMEFVANIREDRPVLPDTEEPLTDDDTFLANGLNWLYFILISLATGTGIFFLITEIIVPRMNEDQKKMLDDEAFELPKFLDLLESHRMGYTELQLSKMLHRPLGEIRDMTGFLRSEGLVTKDGDRIIKK